MGKSFEHPDICEDGSYVETGLARATFHSFQEQKASPNQQLRRLKALVVSTNMKLPPGDRLLIDQRIRELEQQLATRTPQKE